MEPSFPYPLGVNVADSVTLKLCPTNYFVWNQLMLTFLDRHNLSGFINGTIDPPNKPSSLKEKEEELKRECERRENWKQKHMKQWDWEKQSEERLREWMWEDNRKEEWDRKQELWEVERKQEEERHEKWRQNWANVRTVPPSVFVREADRKEEWDRKQEGWEVEKKQEEERREEWKKKWEELKESQEEQKRRKVWNWERQRRNEWSQEKGLQEEEIKYTGWKRSDDLVRGWILAMVTEEILVQVIELVTARDVWIKLEKILTPPIQLLPRPEKIDWTNQERGQSLRQYVALHKAVLTADWDTAKGFLDRDPNVACQPITWSLETALIVAVRSAERNHFVQKLLLYMTGQGNIVALLEQKDISGATALHAAADGGNTEAAEWLVMTNWNLVNIADNHGNLAVHVAAGLGNREMVDFLLRDNTTDLSNAGLKLLHSLASSGLYDIALKFLREHRNLASMDSSGLLEVIAQKRTSFKSGTSLNWLERLIYSGIPSQLDQNQRNTENHAEERVNEHSKCVVTALIYVRKKWNALFWQKLTALFWDVAEKRGHFNCIKNCIKSVRKTKLLHDQALNLVKWICEEVVIIDFPNAAKIFTEPLRNATCLGIHEIVEEILEAFPGAIHLRSEKDQSLFQIAIVYRRANVFNLIHQTKEDRRAFLSIPDASTNNALHLAGNLAPQQQLLLRASAAGAALQMQRELQWFKVVGDSILPQAKEHRNADRKTPQEVFTETHKDLVKEGEQWMKDTATSCTIVAVLIMTIVFAAAIVVPGGSFVDTEKSGLPIRLGDRAFTWFGVSDALALFSSSASLLMFLSILTSRYGEKDFLYSLPTKLIIGLFTLFISIISMMVAFGATLKIVFGEKKAWIIYPVVVSCCVPITLFAVLQFSLLYAMVKSTYFSGLFRKQSNRILH